MERVAHVAHSFADADRWDAEQLARMTLAERIDCARVLQERVYGTNCMDVRAAVRADPRNARRFIRDQPRP